MSRLLSLSLEDRRTLDRLWRNPRRATPGQQDIAREGDAPAAIHILVDGWACRYKMLEDGRRQITGFVLPGDIGDPNAFLLRHMDHSLMALTPTRHVSLTLDDFDFVRRDHPALYRALLRDAQIGAAIQREWIVNLGQRSALERMSHLLCELFVRLRSAGLVAGNRCELPITQIELADALGLTPVHISRTLKELRGREIIRLKDRELEIIDLRALANLAMFTPDYLQLGQEEFAPDTRE